MEAAEYLVASLGVLVGVGLVVLVTRRFFAARSELWAFAIGGSFFVLGGVMGSIRSSGSAGLALWGVGAIFLGETMLTDLGRWIRLNQATSGRIMQWHAVEANSRFALILSSVGFCVMGAGMFASAVLA
jgi:hypothetical protein